MSDNPIGIRPLSLGFADSVLESAFRVEQARKMIKPTRTACVAGSALVLLGGALIAKFVPEAREQLAISMSIVLAILVAMYSATYARHFARTAQIVALAGTYGMALAYIAVCAQLSLSSLPAVGILLFTIYTFNVYSIVPMRFPLGCIAGWGTSAVYLGYLSSIGALQGTQLAGQGAVLVMVNLCGMIASYFHERATRGEFLALRLLGQEREHSERLLLNILPANVIQELAATGKVKPARYEDASILFTDFVSFTQATSTMPADRMVAELNDIFGAFDDIAHEEGIEKIKTIGDAYMAASGLSDGAPNHAERCVRAALRMTKFMEERNRSATFKWHLRVGIHSGPVISGVVGKRKYAFDIWGDAVNIASRMESSGEAGEVNISAYTYDLIRSMFPCTYRGKVNAKGKGEIDMYFVDMEKTALAG